MVSPNIQCSACGAKLKSSASVSTGKRIRCSKCGAVFSVTKKESEPDAEKADVPSTGQPQHSDDDPLGRAPQPAKEPDERKPLQSKRRKKRLKKQKADLQKWIVGLACGAVMVALGFGIFLVVQQVRGRIQARWLRENNERVTMENYDNVAVGAKLGEAKAILGDGRTTSVEEVEDAYRMESVTAVPGGIQVIRSTPENSLRGMVQSYTIETWYRWQNKTANVFAGLRKGDDGSSQIAVLGFLNNDPATNSFGAAWKVLPISAEISSSGSRVSVGKPLPQGSLANISKVRRGMGEQELSLLLGSPLSILGPESGYPPSSLTEQDFRSIKIWRYIDKENGCLPPPAFGASTVGLAASPPETGSFSPFFALVTQRLGYDIELRDGRLTDMKTRRLP